MSSAGLVSFDQPGLWPSEEQKRVLQAALLDDDRALDGFRAWRQGLDIDAEFDRQVFRLLPLLHHNLHRMGVADSLMGRLKGAYRMSWVKTHQLFAKMSPLVAALRGAGIDVMLLKGAPLVLAYYGNYGLRPMADIDLLIRRSDLAPTIALLQARGWIATTPMNDDVARFRHALQFVDGQGGEFDLHWHALYEFCENEADAFFWDRSEPLDFGGVLVRMPNPTAMMFHTVVHGVRWNQEPPVRWIADAMQILKVRRAEIDWDQIVEIAMRHHICNRLHLGLTYLVEMLDADIPADVMNELARQPMTFVERIEARSVLRNHDEFYATPLGNLWMVFSDYCRAARGHGPLKFAEGFSHYLRFRWNLEGRSQIPSMVLRGLWKRAAGPSP